MSEEMNLCEKLIEIRKCVPYLQKNTTGYKYNYVSGASVLGRIKEKMNELGILLYPSISNRGILHFQNEVEFWDAKAKEHKTRIDDIFVIEGDVIMTWRDAETGEKLEVPFLLFGKQNDPSKAFGSGLTYSERYFLLKFFNIPTDDEDPDRFQEKIETGMNIKASTKPDHKKKDFVHAISSLFDKIPLLEFEKLVKSYGVESYKKITDRETQETFYVELQAKIKAQPEKPENELPFEKPK